MTNIRLLCSCAFLLFASNAAVAVTKEEIASAYNDKLEWLNTYRLQYTEHKTSFNADGDVTMENDRAYEYLSKGEKVARFEWVIDSAGESPQQTLKDVQNERQKGKLWYSSGNPSIAEIDLSRADEERVTHGAHTPIAYSGLHNGRIAQDGQPSDSAASRDLRLFLEGDSVHILLETQRVGNYVCVVAEKRDKQGRPKIRHWLSPDMQYALCKTEIYNNSENEDPLVRMRILNADFSEIEPGLFIPSATEVESYFPEYDMRLGYKSTYLLTSMECNPDLPDSFFDLEIPNGVLVRDRSIGKEYVIGTPDSAHEK